MKNTLFKNDAGVNVMVEYLITLMITMTLFTLLLFLLNNVLNTSGQTASKEEFDIIANDLANRISAFSSEERLNSQPTLISTATVSDQSDLFDLPQLPEGKQYNITITNGPTSNGLTFMQVKVSSVSDSAIFSTATFSSSLPMDQPGGKPLSVMSLPGQYGLYYDPSGNTIGLRSGL